MARVVTRRPHGTKCIFKLPGQHRVGGGNRCTGSAQRRSPGVDIDGRVGINLCVRRPAGCNLIAQTVGQAAQRRHIHAAVRQLQIGNRGDVRVTTIQRIAHAGN